MGSRGYASVLCVWLAACGSESVNDNPNGATGGSGGSGGSVGGSGGSVGGSAGAVGGSSGAAGTSVGGNAGAAGTATGGTDAGTGGAAGAATGGSAGGGGGTDPLDALSDEFLTDPLASKWTILNPGLLESNGVSLGQLELVPGQSFWYQTNEGPLVYQGVTGNFRVTTQVTVLGENGTGLPNQPVHWAGLMARNPSSASPSTIHVVIGKDAQNTAGITLEWASTLLGTTNFENDPWSASVNVAELRICRVGSNIHLLTRMGGGSWTTYTTQPRPDLPATLHVGPVTHANTSNPNLLARYAWVHFASVAGVGECSLD